MVSPDKELAQDKASAWPSAGRIDLTLAAKSQQEPSDGGFAIRRPAVINPYLNKKQCSCQESSVNCLDQHHKNDASNEEEKDDDDDSCDSVKAFLLPTMHPEKNGMPLGELTSDNEGRCYYEFLQGGMLIFTTYNGNQQPAFILHTTIAAKFRMPPLHSHFCSGVNYSVTPNTNERLMLPGNKSYMGVVVNWTDFHGKNKAISFFCKYVHFLNTYTYKKIKNHTTLRERIHHQKNPSTYRPTLSPDLTQNPKRKLGDVITLSDAVDHLQKVKPHIFTRRVYQEHPILITCYFNHPSPCTFPSTLASPLRWRRNTPGQR
jgi:hypothetical protein